MDFGGPSFDGFVPSKSNETSSQSLSMENKHVFGELMFDNKQARSSAGSDDFNFQKTMLLPQNSTPLLRSSSMVNGDAPQRGLVSSFSSLKPEVTSLISKDDDGFKQCIGALQMKIEALQVNLI